MPVNGEWKDWLRGAEMGVSFFRRVPGQEGRKSKPFQYHALGVKPSRIPSTEKYTIEKK